MHSTPSKEKITCYFKLNSTEQQNFRDKFKDKHLYTNLQTTLTFWGIWAFLLPLLPDSSVSFTHIVNPFTAFTRGTSLEALRIQDIPVRREAHPWHLAEIWTPNICSKAQGWNSFFSANLLDTQLSSSSSTVCDVWKCWIRLAGVTGVVSVEDVRQKQRRNSYIVKDVGIRTRYTCWIGSTGSRV